MGPATRRDEVDSVAACPAWYNKATAVVFLLVRITVLSVGNGDKWKYKTVRPVQVTRLKT